MIATTRRQVLRTGQKVILRRMAGSTATDVVCTATVRGYAATDLAGTLQQGDREVIITNHEIAAAGWPGPPRKGTDRVVIAGATTTVQSVETRYIGGAIDRHVIQVRG
jgi:hypothetical protein